MKIYAPKHTKQSLGGGFTFRRSLIKGLLGKGELVDTWQECDVVLITGATMTDRDEMKQAKAAGKKIVFRIDNLPKDSRNRGTAFSRTRCFADMADHIVFQSEWALEYVGWWLAKNGSTSLKNGDYSVIYNGIDKDHFFYIDKPLERKGNIFMYVQFNRDENKRFPEAAYDFHMRWRERQDIELQVVGQFSPKLVEYDFDFFDGETVSFIPPISEPKQMGNLMRQAKFLYFPAFIDAAPNTVIEAMNCGLEILCVNEHGGTKEIIDLYKSMEEEGNPWWSIREMSNKYLEVFILK